MLPSYDPKPAPRWANVVAAFTRRMPVGRYWMIHRLCRELDQTFVGKMPGELGGYRFECCLRDHIAREVFFAGRYGPQESALVRAVLRPGMTFVDAGANWGFFTLLAAHLVGTSGKVIALEPDPRIFPKLQLNVQRNHLDQVQIFELAAANCISHPTLAGHEESTGNWGISRLVEKAEAGLNTYVVRACPLDTLLDEAKMESVDLLKIDVEGAEDLVLAGMEAGLKTYRYRHILLELHPHQLAERQHTMEQVMSVLQTKGYKGYALDHSPAAFRRACYYPDLHFSNFIRPLEQVTHDVWPHTFWTLPGKDLNDI